MWENGHDIQKYKCNFGDEKIWLTITWEKGEFEADASFSKIYSYFIHIFGIAILSRFFDILFSAFWDILWARIYSNGRWPQQRKMYKEVICFRLIWALVFALPCPKNKLVCCLLWGQKSSSFASYCVQYGFDISGHVIWLMQLLIPWRLSFLVCHGGIVSHTSDNNHIIWHSFVATAL